VFWGNIAQLVKGENGVLGKYCAVGQRGEWCFGEICVLLSATLTEILNVFIISESRCQDSNHLHIIVLFFEILSYLQLNFQTQCQVCVPPAVMLRNMCVLLTQCFVIFCGFLFFFCEIGTNFST